MGLPVVIFCSLTYVFLLFLVAWWVDRRSDEGHSVVNNSYIYALSLAVYCTAWTFYGSVGRATTGGLSFLAIYLGPTLFAPLWYMVLRKIMLISKNQRITSIADFISSRYGKSATLGVLVTVIAVLGIIPYISIQLKAVTFGINTLTKVGMENSSTSGKTTWLDSGFYIALAMALFTIFFGTRKLDPNERHEGLVAAVALESLVKLIAFLMVGVFVTYGIFDGFEDLFQKALQQPEIARLTTFSGTGVSNFAWNMLLMLSFFAIILLPRQFHISIVESTSPRHIPKSMWIFPLYLLLINIFVLPIALAGKMIFGSEVHPDTYVLSLPMSQGASWIALVAFLGGFSAAISMVVVEANALAIMFSNHIIVPFMIKTRALGQSKNIVDGASRLLDVRRVSILLMLFLAYWYEKSVGATYDLVSVGLISFAAAAQLAPATIGALYWKRGTTQGAVAGLIIGFLVWAYCLPLANMAQAGILSDDFVKNGLFGISFLKPYSLFGLTGVDAITNGAFWSLLLNTWTFLIVSINTQPTTLSLRQADLFVNIEKYISGQDYDILKREAKIADLRAIAIRFLGENRGRSIFQEFEIQNNTSLSQQKIANAELVNFVETHLAGAIGAASARLVVDNVAKEEIINIEEVMSILDQTREAVEHSRAMETKNSELQALAHQLSQANEQLKTLDRLKADFISTVTHELRTPVTSIKALSNILLNYHHELDDDKKSTYMRILAQESDRIARLINQVLDIEKLQSEDSSLQLEPVNLTEIVQNCVVGMEHIFSERNILCIFHSPKNDNFALADRDRLTQVVVNLLSNALKFCNPTNGKIDVRLFQINQQICLQVADNGSGIDPNNRNLIFERFTQIHNPQKGKPQGTGLGLFITKKIVELHGGTISVKNDENLGGALFEICLPIP